MTNKTTQTKHGGMNPVAMGLVGTGLAVGAAMILSDKKRRQKIGKTIQVLSAQAGEKIDQLKMVKDELEENGKDKSVVTNGKKLLAKIKKTN